MANSGNLEQQIAGLQISHTGDVSNNAVKSGKKIGPAVPPKPKKSQPQVCKLSFIIVSMLIIIMIMLIIISRVVDQRTITIT